MADCLLHFEETRDQKEKKITMVILETKYLKELDGASKVQVLGYYCKSKGSNND